MKKSVLTILTFLLLATAYAQQNPDSVAYQLQRQKINMMLEQRRQKFGQYDQSLKEHTGIFGLQTKKDIRHSNDILMDIVKTDNDLYEQIKVLLGMNTFQQKQALDKSVETAARAKETETYNIGFMNTINRMRAKNEQLQKQLDDAERNHAKTVSALVILLVLMLLSIFLLLRSKYAAKR